MSYFQTKPLPDNFNLDCEPTVCTPVTDKKLQEQIDQLKQDAADLQTKLDQLRINTDNGLAEVYSTLDTKIESEHHHFTDEIDLDRMMLQSLQDELTGIYERIERLEELENSYKLIDIITLETDGFINFTKKPDGTNYKFKKIKIFVEIPENNPGYYDIYAKNDLNAYISSSFFSVTEQNRKLYVLIEINNHLCETYPAQNYNNGAKYNYSTFGSTSAMQEFSNYITSIESFSQFKKGTIFKIYGV